MEISPALLASAAGLLPEDGPTAVEVDGTVALLLHCKKWETDTYPDISGYFPSYCTMRQMLILLYN